jgi:hypothetical protein
MLGYLKHVMVGVVCVLVLGIAGTFAKGDPTTSSAVGTIGGTVTGVNGAVSGVTIKVFAYHGKKAKGSSSSTTTTTRKHQKVVPVGQATSDANGNFTISNIPDGEYTVTATLKGVGRGHATANLTGTSVSVNITLSAGHKKAK